MRSVLLLAMFLLIHPARADAQLHWPNRPVPESVRLHVASWHDRGHFNNANLGLAFNWPGGLSAGGYYNSMDRASWYAGFFVPVYDHHALRFDVMMGAVTGYSDATPAIPVVVPVLGYRVNRRNSIQLVLMPAFILPANVVHAMYEVRL